MHWDIPRMWEGGECWIIGGGPSVPYQFEVPEDVISAVLSKEQPLSSYSPYFSPIHDKHVIGVNAAFLLGDWIDIVFFGDGGFYRDNKAEMDLFSKIKVSCNTNITKKDIFCGVKYVPRNRRHPFGISTVENTVSWNLNSGAAAINLAYHLGVRRIYLLGFDQKLGEAGNQHWHRHYSTSKNIKQKDEKKLPFKRHLLSFKRVENDAKSLGVEILNVSPNSKIEAFKQVKLSEVL